MITPWRSVRPSLCSVHHFVAVGLGWQLLCRLHVILDLDSINQSSGQVCHTSHKYSITGLPGTMFLEHQVWAIWFIVRRWVWDADMPQTLVADEMGLGKTFTTVAAAIFCKLATEKVVMGLPPSIVWGNTLEEWVILVHNDFRVIVGEAQKWYLLQRLNSVPCHMSEIQTTPPHRHPALILPFQPILVYTMPGVAGTFTSVIDEVINGTDFQWGIMLQTENENLTHDDLNTGIDKPENRWNIHFVSYNTLTSRAKPSSDGQLSYWVWSFEIFEEFHRY